MNNKKCHYCGFINFVQAEACRKCEAVLSDAAEQSVYDRPPTYRGGVNAYSQPYAAKKNFSFLKGFLLSAASLVVVATVLGWGGFLNRFQRIKWREYHPDGLSFTVMMPNEPTRIEPQLTPLPTGNMSNHTFLATVSGQGTVMFCYVDYTGATIETSRASEALDATLDEFITLTKSTLVAKKSITYQEMPGLEFEVSPPAEGATKVSRGYGKIFFNFNSSRLFVLSITANEGSDLLAGKDQFLNPKIPIGPRLPKIDSAKLPPLPDFNNRPVYQPGPDDLK